MLHHGGRTCPTAGGFYLGGCCTSRIIRTGEGGPSVVPAPPTQQERSNIWMMNERDLSRVLHVQQLTLRAAAKLFFRLVAMLMSRGSRQVIMAMPAVRFLIMWWAARRMRDSSESRAKSFLMICSQVVMAILMERSTTGCTSSWTARSTDCRTHCFSWGCACSRDT